MWTKGLLRFAAFLVAVMLLTPGGISSFAAQAEQATLKLRGHRLSIVEGGVTIVLPPIPQDSEWILGIAVGDKPSLVPGVLRSKGLSPVAALSQMQSWPPEATEVADGRALLRPVSAMPGDLFLYLTVPEGTRVRILGGAEPISFAVPRDGIMVRSGVVLPLPVSRPADLLVQLLFPKDVEGRGLSKLPDGTYFAHEESLKDNLVGFLLPEFPLGIAPRDRGRASACWFRVTIGVQGTILSVERLSCDEQIARNCESALRTWRWKPFFVDGGPAVVQGTIGFFVGKDGAVRASVFPK